MSFLLCCVSPFFLTLFALQKPSLLENLLRVQLRTSKFFSDDLGIRWSAPAPLCNLDHGKWPARTLATGIRPAFPETHSMSCYHYLAEWLPRRASAGAIFKFSPWLGCISMAISPLVPFLQLPSIRKPRKVPLKRKTHGRFKYHFLYSGNLRHNK